MGWSVKYQGCHVRGLFVLAQDHLTTICLFPKDVHLGPHLTTWALLALIAPGQH